VCQGRNNKEAIDIQDEIEVGEAVGTSSTWMSQKRESITAEMWKDYQSYIQRSM
jgi:hypothetical protein